MGKLTRRATSRQSQLLWFALVLTTSITAWAVWRLYSRFGQKLLSNKSDKQSSSTRLLSKMLSSFRIVVETEVAPIVARKLQPALLGLLLESDLIPYLVIDLSSSSTSISSRLPEELASGSINIPVYMLAQLLSNQDKWAQRFPTLPSPERHDILVLVGTEEQMEKGADIAIKLGFSKVATLDGSVDRYRFFFQHSHNLKTFNPRLLNHVKSLLKDIWNDEDGDEDENQQNEENATFEDQQEQAARICYEYAT
eukprot:TRINITY_DN1772_c0_g2_i1.p2 TRINITY_DN1772_c0_g2~~TRINITY_DN1772_c0_g2_i1.p2  ORF type:complete len:253 (+),score=12.55 TRINITY_DN1772_c0_g2_i1:131-889(+)